MESDDAQLDAAVRSLAGDVLSASRMQCALGGKAQAKLHRSEEVLSEARDAVEIAEHVLKECRKKRRLATATKEDLSDEAVSNVAQFTDRFSLACYAPFLHYVPRLVNIVTVCRSDTAASSLPTALSCAQLAETIPVPGSGTVLPLDLHMIAARCKNAFYAPRRFSAVQLAYSNPRCRCLVFHTGRLVGTGCSGPMAARVALLRAQRQLYTEAGVNIQVRNFAVINTVGAAALQATLNCDAFASAHSNDSHYDSKSFVGLAWRPAGESICCEVYSTGRANLPGSTRERDLQASFFRMLPELLRFSSSNRLVEIFPEDVRVMHRQNEATAHYTHEAPRASGSLWDGWGERNQSLVTEDIGEEDDMDLEQFGL